MCHVPLRVPTGLAVAIVKPTRTQVCTAPWGLSFLTPPCSAILLQRVTSSLLAGRWVLSIICCGSHALLAQGELLADLPLSAMQLSLGSVRSQAPRSRLGSSVSGPQHLARKGPGRPLPPPQQMGWFFRHTVCCPPGPVLCCPLSPDTQKVPFPIIYLRCSGDRV